MKEIKLTFTGYYISQRDNDEEAIADIIERARAEYGNEIADYANFDIVESVAI